MIKYCQTYCCRKHLYREVFPKGGIGAEVGVLYGRNALSLWEEAKPRQLHLIDIWRKDSIYQKARKNINHPRIFFHAVESKVAAKRFLDHYFDWVYVDGCHSFQSVMWDFYYWLPKIKRGGILAGHDFSRPQSIKTQTGKNWHFPGVRKAVHVMLNGPCQLICFTEEDQRSFAMRVH
jgi:hypothetical protein